MKSLALLVAAAALPAAAGEFGHYTIDGEKVALAHGCVVVPHVDGVGYGKPDAIVLLASVPLDCESYGSWVSPASGAFADAVHEADGGLVEINVAGSKLARVSLYGVGYTLGNDPCEGCDAKFEEGGGKLRGSVATTAPIWDGKITLDAKFELPKAAGPAPGEPLAGGGEPGKAYLAYLKAYNDGDYEALKSLMPEGKAESDFGWYADDERAAGIKSQASGMVPATAKITSAWKIGDGALLVTELPSPHGGDTRYRGYASLGFDGKGWRVREHRLDWGSPIE